MRVSVTHCIGLDTCPSPDELEVPLRFFPSASAFSLSLALLAGSQPARAEASPLFVGLKFGEIRALVAPAIVEHSASEQRVKLSPKKVGELSLEGVEAMKVRFPTGITAEPRVFIGVGVDPVRSAGSGVPDWCSVALERQPSGGWKAVVQDCSQYD